MTKEKLLGMLDYTEHVYKVVEEPEIGIDQVWIFSRKEYDAKKKHPRKFKDLYVPYIRVSNFEKKRQYVRDNGLCETISDKELMRRLEEY